MISLTALMLFLWGILKIIGTTIMAAWTVIKSVYAGVKVARAIKKFPSYSDLKAQYSDMTLGKAKEILKNKLK